MKDQQIIAWQRLEGLCLLIVSLFWYIKYSRFQAWGVVVLLFLLPDLAILGYAVSKKIGAFCYNVAHSMVFPLLVLVMWLASPRPIILYATLAWFMHIGVDRAFGFGLKYDDDFKHTHLGRIGKK